MTNAGAKPQALEMATEAGTAPQPACAVDDATFREIFDSQFQYVWNTLRRLGVPTRDLEDVTHDVFLRVYRQRDRYDPARPVRPWLFAFAFRIASDYRRLARHRLEVLGTATEHAALEPTAADRLERFEMLSVGQAALAKVELGQRAVFILYELDGCSMQEIAVVLGIPVNTAYSRLRLAREQFHASLARMRVGRGAQ
jgi:RNA polymerase sigma-70 factor, ECF subfamily